jgi:dTDP-4-amino-4,6-dideoxygalactose transaminase
MQWRVPLADLSYDEQETQAVLEVLHSRWLTMGAVTQQFEEQFAQLVGVRHALAVSNATVALHLACLALGIGPGDEVIVPSFSFVATANAVLYTGAQIRFADIIGPQELNISPAEIERLVNPRTKAVIVMHYGGYPCRMPDILEIAERHNLAVIEDSAHAPGATLHARALGAWGDIGCFSFFSNKNLSTGEGGMLVTDRDDIAAKVRLMRSHGMTSLTWDRHQGHAYTYDVTALGYNYRIDEIRSALGLAQLRKLAANNAQRAALTEQYWAALHNSALELPFRSAAKRAVVTSACHIFPTLLPKHIDRKAFMKHLRAAGVQTSIHYPPIHQFSYHRERYPGIVLPETENVATREVTLPLYPGMNDSTIHIVVEAIYQALSEIHT